MFVSLSLAMSDAFFSWYRSRLCLEIEAAEGKSKARGDVEIIFLVRNGTYIGGPTLPPKMLANIKAVKIQPTSKDLPATPTNLTTTGTFEGCGLCDVLEDYPSRCLRESLHFPHF